MFRSEEALCNAFEGYRVVAFRQGRTNLEARMLTRPVVHFVPFLGCVGVFLPAARGAADEVLLRTAWEAQGAPTVHRPKADERVVFGRVVRLAHQPFAGFEDGWQEGDTLWMTWRRGVETERIDERFAEWRERELLKVAQALLTQWSLEVPPARVVVKPLRPRILGQCTRDREIRLNPSLAQWPVEILEETLAHEVTHLRHFNHSPDFWRSLSALLPDWLPRSLVHYLATE